LETLIAWGELEMNEENRMMCSTRVTRLKAKNTLKHMPKVYLRGHWQAIAQ
jgi:hypothetical protein